MKKYRKIKIVVLGITFFFCGVILRNIIDHNEQTRNELNQTNIEIVENYKELKEEYLNLFQRYETLKIVDEFDDVMKFAAYVYELDQTLMESIMQLETGFDSYAWLYQNNPGGLTYSDGLATFDTKNQGIIEFARVLKYEYVDKGLTTIEDIGNKWCPPSDINCENYNSKLQTIYDERVRNNENKD